MQQTDIFQNCMEFEKEQFKDGFLTLKSYDLLMLKLKISREKYTLGVRQKCRGGTTKMS
jgi:hypothetical protein